MIADIPFIRPGSIDLGPLELQPFGIVVAIGVILGVYLMRRWGETHDLDDDHVRGLVNWTLILGFIGAHLFDVLAYQHERLAEDPLLIFKVWQGISSYGGFIGGTAGFFIYAMRHKLPLARYADMNMVGITAGFTVGRLACTLVHDHVGAYTENFFLATNYTKEIVHTYGFGSPPGSLQPGLHHNLGFYEFLYMLLLCALLYGLSRWRRRPEGLIAAAIPTAYAPVRFFLDYLRVNRDADPRYIGLTFAQWMSIVLTLAGIYLIIRLVRHKHEVAPARVVSRDKSKDRDQADKSAGKNRSKESAGAGNNKGTGAGKARKRRKKK